MLEGEIRREVQRETSGLRERVKFLEEYNHQLMDMMSQTQDCAATMVGEFLKFAKFRDEVIETLKKLDAVMDYTLPPPPGKTS